MNVDFNHHIKIIWTGVFNQIKIWTGLNHIKIWTGVFNHIKIWTGFLNLLKIWTTVTVSIMLKIWTRVSNRIKIWTEFISHLPKRFLSADPSDGFCSDPSPSLSSLRDALCWESWGWLLDIPSRDDILWERLSGIWKQSNGCIENIRYLFQTRLWMQQNVQLYK